MLFDYSRITAPFAGVVTQRYANYGTLMQAGTSSSTQAMPLVRLSQDDLFRLVIPVPESYVQVTSRSAIRWTCACLAGSSTFPGKVARFSVDVTRGHAHHAHRGGCAQSAARSDARPVRGSRSSRWSKDNALVVPLQAVDS